MTSWADIFTFSLGGAMLAMMGLGIAFSAYMPALDRWSKRYFIVLFLALLLLVIVLFIDCVVWANPDMANLERVVCFLEFFLLSAVLFIPTVFLLHCSCESFRKSALFRFEAGLWCVSVLLLIVAQFTEAFYHVTPDNRLIIDPCFALMLIPLVLMLAFNVVGVIRRRKSLSKRVFKALLWYLLPMTVAIIFHMFFFVSVVIVFAMAICALVMYSLILADNIEQYIGQQREIASQKARVMVLQMRPHFIYNTMSGIYYLCDQDPQKAKQVTLDFTSYLRKNFTAIASDKTIPFRDELEHTRAYLAVEQAQYEDSLFVRFDTPHTVFRTPPLTLQPIVENAVKHGLRGSKDPIHILVSTRKRDSSSVIIVEDDGSGFRPDDNNDEPHIALENIRQRLSFMCGGKLEIKEREGGGTLVKVTIPNSDRKRHPFSDGENGKERYRSH